jgi:hypothetical protein
VTVTLDDETIGTIRDGVLLVNLYFLNGTAPTCEDAAGPHVLVAR